MDKKAQTELLVQLDHIKIPQNIIEEKEILRREQPNHLDKNIVNEYDHVNCVKQE